MVPVMDDLLPGMLDLARNGSETLTRQLTDQLRSLISGGRLAPGQRLPSSRHLAQSLDVSRNTVTFAIEQLAAEGYVTLSAGRRPAVAEGLALDRRKMSSRHDAGDRVSLSPWARGLQGRRYMTSGPGRFSRDWRMNVSFHTIFGAVACGARRETHCCAGTGPSTIRRCRKRCWRIWRFIAGSRPSQARS